MRYEDASGAFQASGPIANDDADTLSAGERGPATGNLITGEGTQYGSAGADSAAGAKITAIAGKGGEDTSYSAGKLGVDGEHGRLTVDAEGNYSYMANAGVENVRDRFTYTLADNAGNSDTAALIVEIGKTPAVIKADAQQIVPGPDGVVTLPPGVELSDVRVVGRNLVVDLPDGTQLIIIDGAIFVPQLVLGGVEVPATNVAALLIGQEVQPAAGEIPPSGGGNFALPPPPLDPGIPLGDLIPPTELNYVPPEPQEVFPEEDDEEPEIFVQPDGQPAAIAAVDQVEEAGLPTRNGNLPGEPAGSGESADGNGADNDVTSETTTGNIVYDSPDGVDSITLNGVVITTVGQVIPGAFGDITITSIAPGVIGYSYTLDDNTSGNDTHDDFQVILTDSDGDQASATLRIDIIDDVPTARPDTDVVPAGQYGPVTGNVITDASAGDAGDSDSGADTVGADNATVTAVSSANVPANSDSGAPFVVNGQYGVLTLRSDGSYSYVRNAGTPGGVQDVFNYTLTDGDGDPSSTTLTITIEDATPETRPNPLAQLDDDALPGGIPGGVGDDPDAANLSGNLLGVGGDGPLTFDLLLTGAPAGFSYVDGPDGAVHVMQGTTHVLTITINAATGAYTISQVNPIDHPAGGDENNVQFTINYQVRDQDGDTADGTLNIDVDDDTPEMNRADVSLPTLTVDETDLTTNASADYSVVFDGDFGADGPGTLSYAVSVVNGTDSGLVDVATGDPILLFMNGSVVEGRVGGAGGAVAFTVSVNSGTGVVTLDQIRALEHPLNPNNDEPVSAIADSIQLTASITDADGDGDSLTVNIGHTLVFEDDGPTVSPTLNAQVTVTVDESLPSNDPGINTGGIAKGDDPHLAGGIAIGQSSSGVAIVNANAVFGADGPAAGGGISYALVLGANDTTLTLTDGSTISLQLVGGVVVGVVDNGPFAGQAAFALAIDPTSGVVTVEQYLSLDHPVNPDPNDPLGLGPNSVGVTVTATDGDGDPVTSGAVDISNQITFLDDGPTVSPTLSTAGPAIVDESEPVNVAAIDTGGITKADDPHLGGGLAIGLGSTGGAVLNANAVFGADGPAAAGSLSYDLVILNASSGLTTTEGNPINLVELPSGVIVGVVSGGSFNGQAAFAISINSTTGVVTVEQYLSIDHPDFPDNFDEAVFLNENVLGATVTATDGDGDPVTSPAVDIGSKIQFEDDGPSATDEPQQNVQEGNQTVSGTFDFVGGADGASVTHLNDIALVFAGDGWSQWIPVDDGQIRAQADGDYQFQSDASGSGVTSGTFTVTDGDGDQVEADWAFNITDANAPTAGISAARLDDDGLAGGNPLSTTNDIDANVGERPGEENPEEDIFNGQLTLNFGGDGPGTVTFAAMHNLTGSVGTETVRYTWAGSTLTATVEGGPRNGTVLFDIVVDQATGEYTLTLRDNVIHTAGGDETSAPNVALTYTVTDSDNSPAGGVNGTLNITFNDDGPSATIVETGQAVSVDESVNVQVDSNDTTNAGVIALFAGVTNTGTDTHLPQYAQNASAIVGSTGSVYGADGAGTTAFSLNVSAAGVDSGLDTTAGQSILLFKEGALIVGRVSGGADDGKAAFAIAIDPVTGVVSMVEYLSIRHPNAANPDDSVSIADGAILGVVTVTDADGDTATQSVGIGSAIQFQDSAPVMTAAQNMNIQNSGDVAHTAAFAFNLGADGANIATNDVITNVTGSATVGGVAVQNWTLTPGAENATTASYSFSFDYPVGGGNTAHATGTLVFDKVAGTYTVDLANPIQGVTTILQTAEGTLFQGYEFGTSNLDGSQPEISVTQIQDLAGTANDIFVQFTSVSEPSSGTGDNNLEVTNWVPGADNPPPVNGGGDTAWNAGQLFNQEDSWVSTSNSANGVAGDTIQGGEVLDFSLVQGANPTGNLAQPATFAQASAMFLKFDGIGASEDMIVVLKLYDPNTNTYTTRAIMVENGDIQKGPGAGPGQFSGITLDNNDGLVIIESNDYNQPGENWVIVGAQIAGSDEGVTGTAVNLNSAIGVAGDSDVDNNGSLDTDALGFQSDTDDGPFKISSIGFLTTSTTPQNAHLDFNVTVTDGDGDSITQAIAVDVTAAADSTSAATIPAGNTTVSQAPLSSKSTAAVADSYQPSQQTAANSNTGITSAMVAASGLAAMSMTSLNSVDQQSFGSLVQDSYQLASAKTVVHDSLDQGLASISFGSEPGGSAVDAVNLSSSGFSFGDRGFGGGSLEAMSSGGAEPAYVPSFASGEPMVANVPAFAANVPTVSMASAEMLKAAALDGDAQQGGAVEQVLADALGEQAPTIDGLLANLPGGIAELAAIAHLASPDGAGVPAWDMGMQGGFAPMHDMVMKVAAVALHHDAVQPA